MSTNILSLKPSKTEFLIFDLPQQLSKLNNYTTLLPSNVILSSVDSARDLGIIFDKICHLHNISLLFVNHASTILFVTKDVFVKLLIKLLPASLLLLSFTRKLTIVTLFYSIYLQQKLTIFNLSYNYAARAVTKLINFITLLLS